MLGVTTAFKSEQNKLEACPSRELDVTEAEVEVVAPDGQPLHVRDLDVRGQADDQPSLQNEGLGFESIHIVTMIRRPEEY